MCVQNARSRACKATGMNLHLALSSMSYEVVVRRDINHTLPKFCDVKELCATPIRAQGVGGGRQIFLRSLDDVQPRPLPGTPACAHCTTRATAP